MLENLVSLYFCIIYNNSIVITIVEQAKIHIKKEIKMRMQKATESKIIGMGPKIHTELGAKWPPNYGVKMNDYTKYLAF